MHFVPKKVHHATLTLPGKWLLKKLSCGYKKATLPYWIESAETSSFPLVIHLNSTVLYKRNVTFDSQQITQIVSTVRAK